MSDPLEKIIRPIVEGQIRGFIKEHPVVLSAVDWYKPRQDKTETFVNSMAKRIVRDLTCPLTRARLESALCQAFSAASANIVPGTSPGDDGGLSDMGIGQAVASTGEFQPQVGGVNLEQATGLMPSSVHGNVSCDGWGVPGIPTGSVAVISYTLDELLAGVTPENLHKET
jgi:hypothetical protein